MRRWLTLALCCLLPLALLGCGGGAGSTGTSGSTGGGGSVGPTGQFQLMYTGGSIPGVKHAWVTVTKVVLNEDINKTWVQGDATWKVVTQGLPVTIDLAAPSGGFIVGSSSGGVSIPVGTYRQVRLILAGHDETLKDSARKSDGTPFAYNAQIEYQSGAVVPIELPNLLAGFKLDRGVQVTASSGSTTSIGALAAHIDLDRVLVRFDGGYQHSGNPVDAVTLRMRSFSSVSGLGSGASLFWGQIDPTTLCGSPVVNVSAPDSCVSDVTVSLYGRSRATKLDEATGEPVFDYGDFPRMINLFTTRVDPSVQTTQNGVQGYGIFVLSPILPDGDTAGTYDLVIRGRGMRTMVIQDVPVKPIDLANLEASDGVDALGTYLGKAWKIGTGSYRSYIRPELIGSDIESQADLSGAQTPTSSRVMLGMRLASRSSVGTPGVTPASYGPLPYELISANTDPFTGLLRGPLPLPKGNPVVARYPDIVAEVRPDSVSAPIFSSTFASETPVDGGLIPMALGRFYDEGAFLLASPVTDSATTFSAVPLAFKAAVATRSVTVSATGLPAALTLERADLVISDVGGIVHTEDVKSRISGGALSNIPVSLPDGLVSNGYATGVYSFAIRTRALGATTPAGTTWYRSASQLNLRTGSTTSISIP